MAAKKTTKKKTAKKAAKKKTVKEKTTQEPPKEEKSSTAIIWAVVAVAILLVVVGVVRNSGIVQKDVAATVNGEPIYASELDEQIARLPDHLKATATKELVLSQTIDKVLVLQFAKNNGITATEEEVTQRLQEQLASFGISEDQLEQLLTTQNYSMDKYRKDLEELVILDKIIEQEVLPKAVVSEDDIASHYQEKISEFSAAEGQKHIRHILVATEEEAFDVLDKALAGEDFAELAKEYSTGPSGPNGGSLGFIDKDSPLVPEFSEAALKLEIEEVSDPVETQFGWHVIFRDQDTIPLSEVRDSIRVQLEQQAGRDLFEEFLNGLRESATIKHFEQEDSEEEQETEEN